LSVLALFGFVIPVWADEPKQTEVALAEAIDDIVGKQVKFDGPGMVIAIVEQGKVVFRKGYGLANIEKQVALTPHTTFELASVSKQFTALAVMILHDRGKLAFDDDVRKHLSELPEYDPQRPILVHDLLHHTSGLTEYFDFPDIQGRSPKFLGNDDYLPAFARLKDKFPLQFPTGKKYQYTNSNYLVLASLVERVSGQSFGVFMAKEVFQPLDMKDTVVFENPEVKRHNPATGYRKVKKEFEVEIDEKLLTTGDGAIWSSVADMVQWDKALRDGMLVKPKTMDLAYQPSKTDDGMTNEYGFGWSLRFDDNGKPKAMNHGGAWTGYRTFIERDLVDQRTVLVLANCSAFDVAKTAAAITDEMKKHTSPKR
jgi:CubicO group peptidase (beta-lactamase class C family)